MWIGGVRTTRHHLVKTLNSLMTLNEWRTSHLAKMYEPSDVRLLDSCLVLCRHSVSSHLISPTLRHSLIMAYSCCISDIDQNQLFGTYSSSSSSSINFEPIILIGPSPIHNRIRRVKWRAVGIAVAIFATKNQIPFSFQETFTSPATLCGEQCSTLT